LMRGDAFVLYVNGSYVAAITNHIDHAPLPRAGRVGVYLNDGAAQGVFTNFAVYPVTSPPSLEYV